LTANFAFRMQIPQPAMVKTQVKSGAGQNPGEPCRTVGVRPPARRGRVNRTARQHRSGDGWEVSGLVVFACHANNQLTS
jgi:hypothetical protein